MEQTLMEHLAHLQATHLPTIPLPTTHRPTTHLKATQLNPTPHPTQHHPTNPNSTATLNPVTLPINQAIYVIIIAFASLIYQRIVLRIPFLQLSVDQLVPAIKTFGLPGVHSNHVRPMIPETMNIFVSAHQQIHPGSATAQDVLRHKQMSCTGIWYCIVVLFEKNYYIIYCEKKITFGYEVKIEIKLVDI